MNRNFDSVRNIKEKLISLLAEKQLYGIAISEECSLLLDKPSNDEIANHLISNGVTVQKWIPVAERLPEYGEEVLIFTVDKQVTTSRCVGLRVDRYQDITHWMPLPEPPKEVE